MVMTAPHTDRCPNPRTVLKRETVKIETRCTFKALEQQQKNQTISHDDNPNLWTFVCYTFIILYFVCNVFCTTVKHEPKTAQFTYA